MGKEGRSQVDQSSVGLGSAEVSQGGSVEATQFMQYISMVGVWLCSICVVVIRRCTRLSPSGVAFLLAFTASSLHYTLAEYELDSSRDIYHIFRALYVCPRFYQSS